MTKSKRKARPSKPRKTKHTITVEDGTTPAVPLTNAAAPGGRHRAKAPPDGPFQRWLATCGLTLSELTTKLGCSSSSIYNARNGYFVPGRDLAVAIARLSDGAVPVDSWTALKET